MSRAQSFFKNYILVLLLYRNIKLAKTENALFKKEGVPVFKKLFL